MEKEHYRIILLEEYSKRKRKNPAYSVSAFARSIGISLPSLSQVLSGKRPLGKKSAIRILERCPLDDVKRRMFIDSSLGAGINQVSISGTEPKELEVEAFRAVADWRHYAILNLAELSHCKHDPRWIAEELNISIRSATEAFNRLLTLGLIKREKNRFTRCVPPFSLPTRLNDRALQQAHHELLNKANEVLDEDTTRTELYSSITMAVDESKLEEARKLITKFRREICSLLENGKKERVYTLAVQLFPLSKQQRGN